MRDGVRKREGAAPAASKHLPLLYTEVDAQEFHVSNLECVTLHELQTRRRTAQTYQMPGGVVFQRSVRSAFAAATLVKHYDAVSSGIEKASEAGRSAAARATVHHDDGFAHWVATLFVIKRVNIGNLQHASVVGVNLRVELQALGGGLHSSVAN